MHKEFFRARITEQEKKIMQLEYDLLEAKGLLQFLYTEYNKARQKIE